MLVTPLPAFSDNYIWAIERPGFNQAVVVDPGNAKPVSQWLKEQGKHLSGILITHNHYDHVMGVPELRRKWPDTKVYGPARESFDGMSQCVGEGDRISLLGDEFEVMDVPGHTAGHIAYRLGNRLFCGDTLFAAGCGRVFDGTMEQLALSVERIAGLPVNTLIYCTHEYTLDNLGFALWVEPDNQEIRDRLAAETEKRNHKLPTLPTSLQLELATNPFIRTSHPQVIEAAQKQAKRLLNGHVDTFKALRHWKDSEYD